MPRDFAMNGDLVTAARQLLQPWKKLYWILGGAGSGKTTVTRILHEKTGLPLYDMDERIYGSFHGRFSADRHPVNFEWSHTENGFAWLLNRTWDSFLSFNRAATAEYIDLLAEDLAARDPEKGLLIDGGIFTPTVAARVIPRKHLICIAAPWQTSPDIWEGSPDRLAMKSAFESFPDPDSAWLRFLDFDRRITETLLTECRAAGIRIITRKPDDPPEKLAVRIWRLLAGPTPTQSNGEIYEG